MCILVGHYYCGMVPLQIQNQLNVYNFSMNFPVHIVSFENQWQKAHALSIDVRFYFHFQLCPNMPRINIDESCYCSCMLYGLNAWYKLYVIGGCTVCLMEFAIANRCLYIFRYLKQLWIVIRYTLNSRKLKKYLFILCHSSVVNEQSLIILSVKIKLMQITGSCYV